jgi:hypothetical protein
MPEGAIEREERPREERGMHILTRELVNRCIACLLGTTASGACAAEEYSTCASDDLSWPSAIVAMNWVTTSAGEPRLQKLGST